MALLSAGCTGGILKNPAVMAGQQWKVSADIVQVGPDYFISYYDARQYENLMKRICDFRSHIRDRNGTCSGQTAFSGTTSKEITLVPRESENGFVWMKVTVKNMGAAESIFDFSRLRLIFPESVSKPDIIYTHEQNTMENFSCPCSRGQEITRYLVFVSRAGTAPYRMVYDQFAQGKVSGKMAVDFTGRI